MTTYLIAYLISAFLFLLSLAYFFIFKVRYSWWIVTGKERRRQLRKLNNLSNEEIDLDTILRDASSLKERVSEDTTNSEMSIQNAIYKANIRLEQARRSEERIKERYQAIKGVSEEKIGPVSIEEIKEDRLNQEVQNVVESVRGEDITEISTEEATEFVVVDGAFEHSLETEDDTELGIEQKASKVVIKDSIL